MNKLQKAQLRIRSYAFTSSKLVGLTYDHDPMDLPSKSPPEVPTAPPFHSPTVPTPVELPRTPNVLDFDPIPSENLADPPPFLPGPPNPSLPKPEGPVPPMPPGEPEVIPPHGPDVIPPKPPEPGPPNPTQPDIPPPIMGSDGLMFY